MGDEVQAVEVVQLSREELETIVSEAASAAADDASMRVLDVVAQWVPAGGYDALVVRATESAASAAAESVSSEVRSSLAAVSGTRVVRIDSGQFGRLASLGASQLHSSVYGIGLLAMLLGAVVAVGMTLHWRSRG